MRRARDAHWYLEVPASVVCLWNEQVSAASLVCQAGPAGKEGTCGMGQEVVVSAGCTEGSHQCSQDS